MPRCLLKDQSNFEWSKPFKALTQTFDCWVSFQYVYLKIQKTWGTAMCGGGMYACVLLNTYTHQHNAFTGK